MTMLCLGVDFDNTIVCYDDLFHRIAVEQGLIPASLAPTKEAVRDYLRQQQQEDQWTEMQGYVYGARMSEAAPFPGVREFFRRCHLQGLTVHIISHKTRRPYRGPEYDLHQAAHAWLVQQGFLDPTQIGLPAERIHFAETKAGKLTCIADCQCTHFIDDLPEFLAEPGFPSRVEPLLFSPGRATPARFRTATSWAQIAAWFFDEARHAD